MGSLHWTQCVVQVSLARLLAWLAFASDLFQNLLIVITIVINQDTGSKRQPHQWQLASRKFSRTLDPAISQNTVK
ncbi:hypothetical protein BJV77DRAFT_992088 [Russula vinacea]|nr:hypothetical protein BJV77DRAFT_992088 [Russula vinacea]